MNREPPGYTLQVGDISIRLSSEGVPIKPSSVYREFLTEKSNPDIDIWVRNDIPAFEPKQRIFDTGATWKLFTWQDKYLFGFYSPKTGSRPYKIALFTPDLSHGEIYLERNHSTNLYPLNYPLDELLVTNYLAKGLGIEVHALGIIHNSIGLVFIGVSGAGKSTLAELWKKRDVRILSDDRIIFRKKNNRIWMYGTPWHGDAKISLPEKIPLRNIYFLKQAPVNKIVSIEAGDAATRVTVRSFPPIYLLQGMEFTLEFISDLVQKVPCYELQFTPDQRAIDEVLNHVGKSKL